MIQEPWYIGGIRLYTIHEKYHTFKNKYHTFNFKNTILLNNKYDNYVSAKNPKILISSGKLALTN